MASMCTSVLCGHVTCATVLRGHVTITLPPATLHWFSMGLESVYIVEVGLPVLHEAPVICSYHPNAIMTPHHAPNWAVVTLNRAHQHKTFYCLTEMAHSLVKLIQS